MSLPQLKNIIDSARNRIRGDVFYHLKKIKNKKVKILIGIIAGTVASLGLSSMYHNELFILLLILQLPFSLMASSQFVEYISDTSKKMKQLTNNDFEYIDDICDDFPDEQQKLNPQEIKQLLQLPFDEDDLDFLTNRIKDYSYITHDDIYILYEEILEAEQEKEDEDYNTQNKNSNFHNFLIENGLTKACSNKTVQTQPLVEFFHKEESIIYAKSFNSKSIL